MKSKVQIGKQGEYLALNFLKKKGYQILETNWRFRNKEIDIIALHNNKIVFIEVKSRKNTVFGRPEDAVNKKKQKHLIEAAEAYVIQKELDFEPRFDVITIVNQAQIRHFSNAFYPGINQ